MARVEIPAPGDLVIDTAGNVLTGRTVTLKLAGTATVATHYSALTAGTSTTGGLVTHTDGTIVDGSGNRRYVDEGSYDLTISSRTRQIEAISGAIKAQLAYNARDYNAVGANLVNETAYLQAAIEAAAGGMLEIPKGTYKTTSAAGTATVASGSATITLVSPTTGWVNGEPIHGAGIPIGTTILSGAGTATMVLSQNATASASGVAVKTCLLVRPNTTVICHKDALFNVTGTGNAVEFYTPTARTPATTYPLTANGVESAETITVSAANSANFAVADVINIRDTYTLSGESCHRETNIVESVNTGTGVINLKYPINFAYLTASSAFVAKVTPAENVHWRGGRFDLTGVVSNPGGSDRDVFYIEWGLNCSVEDVTGQVFPNKIIDFYGCVNSHQRRIIGLTPSATGAGEGYVCRLTYSRDCSIRQVWGRSVRHTADVSGGSDCLVDGVFSTGGITTNQIAMFLHGLESKRIRTTNVFASNVETAFGAGNGSFGADFDFVAEGIVSHRCDTSIFIGYGCSGWTVRAQTKNTTIRAGAIDNCSNGLLEIACDGITTNPSNYGAINLSGTNSDIVVRARVRNPIYRAINITATVGGGKITIFEPDIDMSTVGQDAINATTLVSTSKILISGGEIKMNNAAPSAINLSGPAGSQLSVERATQISGSMLRGVAVSGGSTDQTVKGAKFRGTYADAQIRADNGTLRVGGGSDFTSGTAIKLATSATAVFIGDVDLSAATTKLSNAIAATITGEEQLRHTAALQVVSTDAAFTLTPMASPEYTLFTAVMAANRIVTLSTTNAYKGAKFRVTRTAASTGAFTLQIGTGPLKSLAVSQWAEFVYDGAAWQLSEFGSL